MTRIYIHFIVHFFEILNLSNGQAHMHIYNELDHLSKNLLHLHFLKERKGAEQREEECSMDKILFAELLLIA